MYQKIDNKIYKIVEIRTEIDLEALKRELADLKEMKEPSKEELAEFGKMSHPYYMDREARMPDLERRISEIEKAIKEVKK